ncbi:MAG: hypothetical protein VW125_01195 [Flavobacteriaceae bacterium]
MTDKIKSALNTWAKMVLNDQAQWDTDQVHQAIQKLYELSVCQKIFMQENATASDLWKRQQFELSAVLETLTASSSPNTIDKEEEFEVPPMMETIKNMVTEMPEPENYERLFEEVDEPPVFVPKSTEQPQSDESASVRSLTDTGERKNINDQFAQSLSIDLNDRLAFIKHLFEENVSDYEAVLSQIITYSTWDEVEDFIRTKVKVEYPHWKEKETIEVRFMNTLQTHFTS